MALWNDPNNPGTGGQSGFQDYLREQGWDGQGQPRQYAQQLRRQGQHPRWDYRHPGQEWPGAQGLGQLGQQWGDMFPQIPGQLGGGSMWNPQQHGGGLMNGQPNLFTPGSQQGTPAPQFGGGLNPIPGRPMNPQGVAPQGLASLDPMRRPIPRAPR